MKAYNAENKKLGQTGVEMTYEELESNPLKSNILGELQLCLCVFYQTNG